MNTVYLIGAGPGDPGLLTRRAAAVLRLADVVVHDALIDPRVLALAPARAPRIDVGKRGGGRQTAQERIHSILVAEAARRRTVVRLKGGDPFVFGRGGEEARALAAAGVSYRVIPGITSGLAGLAWAGIPATERGVASSVTLVTGSPAGGGAARAPNWRALAQAGGTIVVYMGTTMISTIAAELIAGGLPCNTPAAAIEDATLASARIITSTLDHIAHDAYEAGVAAPALFVIGDVVNLRDVQSAASRRARRGQLPAGETARRDGAMAIHLVGISHHTAPLVLRERFALTPAAQVALLSGPLVREAMLRSGLIEVAVLSTCNRTELYGAAPAVAPGSDSGAADALLAVLVNAAAVPAAECAGRIYREEGTGAVRHLCRVAAGLDSMVPGESEIVGQVARARETARKAGMVGPTLSAAFDVALRAGRRARAETGIGRRPTSVGAESARLLAEVLGGLDGRTVLIIGRGKMGHLGGAALRSRAPRARIRVISRTTQHAEALAAELNGEALGWSDLVGAIQEADAVLCASGAPHAVVTREVVERAIGPAGDERRRIFVDVAVPRDVEPGVREVPGVTVYDLDDLQVRLADNLAQRKSEEPAADRIVEQELRRLEVERLGASLRPLLTGMHAQGDTIRRRELGRLLRRLGDPSAGLRAELEAFSQSLVAKLLHAPTRRLRAASDPDQARELSAATRELFGLDMEDRQQPAGRS